LSVSNITGRSLDIPYNILLIDGKVQNKTKSFVSISEGRVLN